MRWQSPSLIFAAATFVAPLAAAQQQPPPQGGYYQQQPPPGGGYQQQPPPNNGGYYQQPPPGYQQQPPPGYQQQPQYQQPQYQQPRQPPPPVDYQEPEPPTHAPKFSLWMGPRLSYMGFGFGFFENSLREPETTGNFAGNGVGLQADIGARISYRYIPYIFIEHGFLGQGHRFEGTDAKTSTNYYGIGFRHLSGDVDSVAFVADIAIGRRTLTVSNGSESYTMSGLEIFKLGLGAEIRLATLCTIEPLLTFAGGSFNDSEGDIKYGAEGAKDGILGPEYNNGKVIKSSLPYVVLSLGVGFHFDVFGK